MSNIIVESNLSEERLATLGVSKWPTWRKEISVFPWVFHEQEIAYILEGECIVTPEGGAATSFKKGDLVTFPAGLKVNWEVIQPLHKHYQLDGSAVGQMFRRLKAAIGF